MGFWTLLIMNNRLKKAHAFAKERHKGQKRKFTNIDYLSHLEDTVRVFAEEDESVITDDLIAGLLHDVVEDTHTTLKEVGQEFGKYVMDLVGELTTDKREQNAKGKAVYLTEKINNMSKRAFTIKLCDRLTNVVGLDNEKIPLEFIEKYVKETKYIIKHINREINEVQQILLNRIKAMLLYLELVYEV